MMINLIKREDIQTKLSYGDLITAFENELGRFNPEIAGTRIRRQVPWEQVEEAMDKMAGPHGLMIFFKADQGTLTSLHNKKIQCTLYTVGNPLIAEKILSVDVRASLYVPFRVCIYSDYKNQNGIIGFDRPSSFLAALQNPALKGFGTLLDDRINGVIQAIRNQHE